MHRYIHPFTDAVRRNPIIAGSAALVLAWLSLPIAVALVALTMAALVFSERQTLESRVERATQDARRNGFTLITQVSAVMADEKGMARRAEAERTQAATWEARATKALLRGDEGEARECLERKRAHDANRAELVAELEGQRQAIEEMRPHVDALHQPDRSGVTLLGARLRRVRAKRSVVLSASGLGDGESVGAVAADVERAEDEVNAMADLLRQRARDPLAAAHEREERDEAIDAELDALKKKITPRRLALPAKRSA
jgi:phage shock protein A